MRAQLLLFLAVVVASAGCTPQCLALEDGEWTLLSDYTDGPDIVETTLGVTLEMQATEGRTCDFTLSGWTSDDGALPDTLPSGGIVNIDEAFLLGDDVYWYSCEGEVDEDVPSVSGFCFSGAPFEMARVGR